MKGNANSYVLLLTYVDNNWMDIGDNIYPKEGYVEAKKFTKDVDIKFGLCGFLWGKTNYFPYEKNKSGHWLVIKVEFGEDLIKTDLFAERYKFNSGLVVCYGNLRKTAKYIMKHKDKDDFIKSSRIVLSEDIAGTTDWRKKNIKYKSYN